MRGFGPDVVSSVRPTGVLLLGFFCSGIQLCVLLIPYLFIYLLIYLDSYLLGDDKLGTLYADQTSMGLDPLQN